jgi:DNA-binding CsgD family transcriptional regulator
MEWTSGSGRDVDTVDAVAPVGPPLRGRNPELAVLGELLDRLLSGSGVVAVLEGRAGMGKSRLLMEIEALAKRLSITVGHGSADPGDTVVPLAPLLEALCEGRSPIIDPSALRDAHASPEQRYWLLHDIEAMLQRSALDGPIIVCLDDLQWSDSATAAALRALPTRLGGVPVGWILATRSGTAPVTVSRAFEHLERQGANRLELGPLDLRAVSQIAADLLHAEPGQSVLDMANRAGGSPFVLVELLLGLRDEGRVQYEDGKVELLTPVVPDRVSECTRRRLDRCSDGARRVAIIAASLGRRFSLDDAATMLDASPSVLLQDVEELIHANVLVDRAGQLGFLHDLTFEGIRTSVPVPVRRTLDRQAASVLLAGGALPIEVAVQLATSAEPGDEVATSTLLKAAEAIGATDPSAAADLSRRALELVPPDHPLAGPLVASTTVWLHAAGRTDEAKAFADTALRRVLPPAQEAEVRLSVASMFSLCPDTRADSNRCALLLQGLPEDLRNRHEALLYHNLVVAGRASEARALRDEIKPASAASSAAHRFILQLASSGLAYAEGRFSDSLDAAEAAMRSSVDAGEATRAHLTRQWRCDTLAIVDRLDDSLALSDEHILAAQRDRQGWALRIYGTGRARTLIQAGRLTDAAVILRSHVTEEVADHITNALDAAAVTALGRVGIHLGDEGLLRSVEQIALTMLQQRAPSVRRHATWILASQASARGDALEAHQRMRSLGDEERTLAAALFPMDVADVPRMTEIALQANDSELAETTCRLSERLVAINPSVASIRAANSHVVGLIKRDAARLREAADLYADGKRPLARASALEHAGCIHLDDGEVDHATRAFDRSLVLFAEAGASWDANRLRGRLRTLGVRRRLVAAARPASGWASLTDGELAVARLVAEGLTNREAASRLFVSQHTVSGHLRSVFAKLNVNSRVDLARVSSHGAASG